ncbi:hypothetical protein [Bacillus sp. FJAT-28004]|uniref:hypothetical protein n=1 Tax=Bacillus sp. FJAT-28004 TaxID=1679165 RepID=UPI000AF5337E|nr:hypothetical protein [Bacillus sp. FJAT-28004]
MLNKYQLAVAVKEPEYLKRLADYIRDSKLGEQWQIIAFTHADALKLYVKQGYKIDLLAAQPELLVEMKAELPNIPVVALVMQHGESKEKHELLQYQPIPQLLQRFTEIHSQGIAHAASSFGTSERPSDVRIISVYSASGGTGKTALALHLVHAASMYQCRTFYLNLERWNTSEAWLGGLKDSEIKEEGMSELLYGLKSLPGQSVNWLMEHRKRDSQLKGDYLASWTNLEDRLTLHEEDAAGLLDTIAQSGQYDLIIVDLDNGLDELHLTIFERSSQVIWVVNDDASVRNKQRMALRYGAQKWSNRFSRLGNKFISVKNHVARPIQASTSEMDGIACAKVGLPEIPEWRGASHVALLSSPLYRAAADQLFKQLYLEGGGMLAER